jgi:oxygen-independent coproporphyrinogen-3 oxidase
MFLDAGEILAGHGYRRYEISNFARTGEDGTCHYSRHNMKYWTHAPYLGLGPASHSFDGNNERFWTHRDLKLWMSEINNGIIPISETETLSENDLRTETVFLGLRTCKGLDLHEFRRKFGFDIERKLKAVIDFYESEGFAVCSSGRFVLTEKGMLAADAITMEILYELDL